ncbi:hypothetical protein [Demequina aurantiaca]|uniref:hypothetical protein n=1 Tax=Demequina aurantiaca TaxID=676200 RepID=UPI003D3488E4
MKLFIRPIVTLTVGAALALGLAGCNGNLPEIDGSRLPEISRSAAPEETTAPAPEETTAPAPAETVTADPAPAETVTADPAPAETESEPADESTTVWWPWALLGVFLIVIIGVLLRKRSIRHAWEGRLAQTKSELSWVEDSLIPQVLSKPTAAEASSLWQAARPRILELDRELHELAEGGLSAASKANAVQGLQALQGLTTSVDAETTTHDVTDADALRARRAAVESARAYARTWTTPLG